MSLDSTLTGEGAVQPAGEQVPILTQYLRIAIRRRWIIIGAVIGCLLASLILTLLATSRYTASSTIEISREVTKVVNVQGVEPPGGGALDMEFYQTQYGLLKSQTLAERIARDLRLYEDPGFFMTFGVTDDEYMQPGNRISAAVRDKRLQKAGEVLLENVAISPVRGSRLVTISFTSPDPVFSARIANAWADHFIQSNLQRRFEATSYARKFLEDRLQQIRARLDESERSLVAYASRERIINIPAGTSGGVSTGERSLVVDELSSLTEQLAEATAKRIEAESRWREADRASAGSIPEALTNEAIAALRQRRAETAADYSKVLEQFEPEYPAARALQSQVSQFDRSIAKEEARVKESLAGYYRYNLAREQALVSRVEGLKSNYLDQRRRSIQYNILQREVDTNRQLYDGLLQRYKEIGVAGGVGTNNVSVVDEADVPEDPSSPRPFRNLMLALVAGSLLGGILAFAREQMDETIDDPTEVERVLGIPLLGAIPKSSNENPGSELQDPKSPLFEAYLAAQANLDFATEHGVPRSLAITSTRPAEGKSTTAYALAHALARKKKKVLLVDSDMRSPSIHGLFGLPNDKGTSNFLAGNDDLDVLISQTSVLNLAVLPAGPQPPNAAELLSGDRFGMFIERLQERFDHVIVDSPPIMGLADAPLIASRVEGVVFAIESHDSRLSTVRVALGRLAASRAKILGAVLTKFESKKAQFGYGYEYGYGYGAEAQDA